MLDAYQHAIALLTRREHGALELTKKLSQKGHTAAAIQEALEKCQQHGLQQDGRFAEQKMRTRVAQGYGPERIRMELQHLGLARELIENTLAEADYDWVVEAQAVLYKKYGNTLSQSISMRQKQKQFLHYRGFSMHTIIHVLRHD